MAARFAGLFAQVPWPTVCKTLLAGSVLVPTGAVAVLIIETGFASPERRIEKGLLRRSHDLRANLDAIRKRLDEIQGAGAQDPQA